MIVLRTPKGWTGLKEVDGLLTEGSWRSHQVPMTDVRENPLPRPARGLAAQLPAEELFDDGGGLHPDLAELPPRGGG